MKKIAIKRNHLAYIYDEFPGGFKSYIVAMWWTNNTKWLGITPHPGALTTHIWPRKHNKTDTPVRKLSTMSLDFKRFHLKELSLMWNL
jgi:hypothetical protein